MQEQVIEGIRQLRNKRLLKIGQNNEIIVPTTVTEQVTFMQEMHAEARAALEAEIANKQLQQHGMDPERQRAGQ